MNEKEIWKPVSGYEGIYEVSSMGRVKSLPRFKYCGHKNSKPQRTKERILSQKLDRLGYVRVKLSKNGRSNLLYLHRIIADAFIKKVSQKDEVNHIDGNKMNNSIENLEWSNRSENMKHAFAIGLIKPRSGENINTSKLTAAEVSEIRNLYFENMMTQKELAEKFCISIGNVNQIINFKTWKVIS